MLTGSLNHYAELYDPSMGYLLQRFVGHKGPITTVALSVDGSLAITGSLDKKVKVWMSVTGQLLYTLKDKSNDSAVTSVVISHYNQHIIAGYENGNVTFWNIDGQPEIIGSFNGNSSITSLDLNKNLIVIANLQGQITILNMELKVVRQIRGHEAITSVKIDK